MNQDTVNAHFDRLAALLATTPLPTATGHMRYATADEFMLMSVTRLGIPCFKHCNTRNYLAIVCPDGVYRIDIPRTENPFERGYFDASI